MFVLYVSGCSYLPYSSKTPAPTQQPDTTRLKAELFQQTNQFIAAQSTGDSAQISRIQSEIESTLQQYLLATATHSGRHNLAMLDSLGQIVIIPVTSASTTSMYDSIRVESSPLVIDYFHSPSLEGELLDLAVTPENHLAALFPDSLVLINPFASNRQIDNVIRFPEEMYSSVHSRYNTGKVTPLGKKYNVITAQFKMPREITVNDTLQNSDSIMESETSDWAISNWTVLAGRALYRVPKLNRRDFRDLIHLPADSAIVLLNERGFLQLIKSPEQQVLWSSNRPWGDRLAALSDSLIAVYDDQQSSFVLFRPAGNELQLVGQSKRFSGRIAGLASFTIHKVPRIVVGISNNNSSGIPITHLEYLRTDQLSWKTPVKYTRPIYPNFDASIALLEQDWKQNYPFRFSQVPSSLWFDFFETLLAYNPDGQLQPSLASSVEENEEGQTWTIHLRRGIRFSDNSVLTAYGILRGWRTLWAQSYENNSTKTWLLDDIQGIDKFKADHTADISGLWAMNDSTLRISLSRHRPHFLAQLTNPIFSVYKVGEETNLPVGTGAFQVTGIRSDSITVFLNAQRNPYFHGGYPGINKIEQTLQTNNLADSLANKSYAGTITRRRADLDYFNKLKRTRRYRFPAPVIYFLAINPVQPPLNNPSLREAVATALDRSVTANIITEAYCEPVGSLISDKIISANSHSDTTRFKLAQPLRIAFRDHDLVARQIAERLAARLSQKRIAHQSPEALSERGFQQLRASNRYDILIDSYIPEFNYEGYNLMQLVSKQYNIPESIQGMVSDAIGTTGSSTALTADKALISQGILYPILGTANFAILPPVIRDVNVDNSTDLQLQNAWIPFR